MVHFPFPSLTAMTNESKRIAALERKVARLEKACKLFEAHRQSWIRMNQELKKDLEAQERGK
jgi:hypothetical protein